MLRRFGEAFCNVKSLFLRKKLYTVSHCPFAFAVHIHPYGHLPSLLTLFTLKMEVPDPSETSIAFGGTIQWPSSTQSLTEISTRNLPGGKARPVHTADNFTVICEPIVKAVLKPRRLTACCWDSFTFTFTVAERSNTQLMRILWAASAGGPGNPRSATESSHTWALGRGWG
jgi:hypothetical protein